ncbi:hypothetical protein FGE12_23975 [Aggregicoccus sp. 17bor-14]|uniref:hypothetical protein n=1 Tax=Myxococcaceae TaxID=31 RepID=UPI00129CE447|nr:MULTISPECIES: hypothetical protein [Myxococcaceae]MBF5045487.1 hypothetical protein [Simulacricoccus sp. 17bor-14]MRI91225.1 hypothetical protein [Aggregicoccus sp. 17bor-14]
MAPLFDTLALLASMAGLACALAGTAARAPRAGLAMMLDLWVAAGLLRLAGAPDWRRVLAAALLVLVRKLVTRALARAALRAHLHPGGH